jgi:hypothetical protein
MTEQNTVRAATLRGAQERAPQDDGGGRMETSRLTEYFGACQGSPERRENRWEEETPAESHN